MNETNDTLSTTIDELLSLAPLGHNHDELRQLMAGRERWTALDIARLDRPSEELLSIILRPELIPQRTLEFLTCDFAEHVLPIWEVSYPENNRPRATIEAVRKWLFGDITDDEMKAMSRAIWILATKAGRWADEARSGQTELAAAAEVAKSVALATYLGQAAWPEVARWLRVSVTEWSITGSARAARSARAMTAGLGVEARSDAAEEERRWQLERTILVLEGEKGDGCIDTHGA